MDSPAPSVLTRGDVSTTGFQYICGRIKLSDIQIKAVAEAIKEGKKSDEGENSEDDVLKNIDSSLIDDEFYGGPEPEIPDFED